MLMNKKEAAEYLSVHPDTLMGEVRKGRVVGIRVASAWRFDKRDLDGYVDGLRREATAAAMAARTVKKKGKVVKMPNPSDLWIDGMKIQDHCKPPIGMAAAKGAR